MCTKRLQLQYACMIKGCETVTSSERNIMKHYLQHGLPKQYLEEQRSNFIYCKKLPRTRYKRIASRSDDTDNSEESSIETTENEEVTEPGQSESEFSKPTSEKESTEMSIVRRKAFYRHVLEISVVVKRRRGRPRKGETEAKKSFGPKRVTRLRTIKSSAVNYGLKLWLHILQHYHGTGRCLWSKYAAEFVQAHGIRGVLSSVSAGIEDVPEEATVPLNGSARKKMTAFHLKTATVVCRRSDAKLYSREVLKLVEFKIPRNWPRLATSPLRCRKCFPASSKFFSSSFMKCTCGDPS